MDNFIDKLAYRFNAQEMIKANAQAETEEMERLHLQIAEYEKILQEMRKLNYKNTELSEKIDGIIGNNANKINAMKEDEQKLITTLKNLIDEQTQNHKAQLERFEEERIERERQTHEKSENEQKIINALKDLTDEQARNREAQLERLEEERLEREKQAQEKEKAENDTVVMTGLLEEKFKQSDDFMHKESVKVYRNVQAVVLDEFKSLIEINEQNSNKLKSKLNVVVTVSIISIIASFVTIGLCVLTLLTTMGIYIF